MGTKIGWDELIFKPHIEEDHIDVFCYLTNVNFVYFFCHYNGNQIQMCSYMQKGLYVGIVLLPNVWGIPIIDEKTFYLGPAEKKYI